MGQRSQIYIIDSRTKETEAAFNGSIKPINPNGPVLVDAIYDSWNYGERMVSRLRGIIEKIEDDRYWRRRENGKSAVQRIASVNFDMHDARYQSDLILEEAEGRYFDCIFDQNFFLGQDNNDGILFINVTDDGIRYALTDGDASHPMNPDEYMNWDVSDPEKYDSWRDKELDPTYYSENQWAIENRTPEEIQEMNREHLEAGEEIVKYTNDNISYINSHSKLMEQKELKKLINHDYTPTVNIEEHRSTAERCLIRKNEEIQKKLKDAERQLKKAHEDMEQNAVNVVQFISGESVSEHDIKTVIESPSVDERKLDIYMTSKTDLDGKIFIKGHIDSEGNIRDNKGQIITEQMSLVVNQQQYERIVARALFEMEVFPQVSDIVARSMHKMAKAGMSPTEIQGVIQDYLDSNENLSKGIHAVSLIPPGLVKPTDDIIEINKEACYSKLLNDYSEISNELWGVPHIAREAIKREEDRQNASIGTDNTAAKAQNIKEKVQKTGQDRNR